MFTNEASSALWCRWMTVLFSDSPSTALMTLVSMSMAGPEVEALAGCAQPVEWHPEGDVLIHTGMALDEAKKMCNGKAEHDLPLMLGTLCHDFGKPATTVIADGKVTAKNHDAEGEVPTRAFLERLEAHEDLIEKVVCLVREHLIPATWSQPDHDVTPKAYNRLMRRLIKVDVGVELLYEVARADNLGRTLEDAKRTFDIKDFLARMGKAKKAVAEENKKSTDIVSGSHLIARGMKPGPEFKDILTRCREIQDKEKLTDPEEILKLELERRTA